MKQNDLLITEDLSIENGDIAIGQADNQNTLHILLAQPGQLRVNPRLGVGILSFHKSPTNSGRELAKSIRQEHDRDGYRVKTLEVVQDPGSAGQYVVSVTAEKIRV